MNECMPPPPKRSGWRHCITHYGLGVCQKSQGQKFSGHKSRKTLAGKPSGAAGPHLGTTPDLALPVPSVAGYCANTTALAGGISFLGSTWHLFFFSSIMAQVAPFLAQVSKKDGDLHHKSPSYAL